MEQDLSLQDYVAILKRRFPFFIIPFALLFLIGTAVVLSLPAIYRSHSLILVESQQIPSDLVRSTVTTLADEQISRIQKRVMTRSNLLAIVDKYDLYGAADGKLTRTDAVRRIRSHINVNLMSADARPRRHNRSATVAFEVSFDNQSPAIAAKVANDLTTLFLDENVKSRTIRASETTDFLAQEAAKLSADVDAIEKKIADYKQREGDALPEHLDMRIGMLERASAELKEIERDIKALEEEKRYLEVELSSVGSRAVGDAAHAGVALSPAEQLAALETELIQKSAVYGPAHPDLRILKRHIAALEREVGSEERRNQLDRELERARADMRVVEQGRSEDHPTVKEARNKIEALEAELRRLRESGPGPVSVSGGDPAQALVQAKLYAADSRLESMHSQKERLKEKIELLQAQIIRTPQVERELKSLSRDYENATRKYEEVKAKQLEAQLAENLEEEQKAERFIVLEPPLVPEEPISPNRQKLMFLVAVLALGVGGGSAFGAEFMDKTIRSAAVVTAMLGRHPIAVIPCISTVEERQAVARRRRWLIFGVVLATTALIALLLFAFGPLRLVA
jgi:uncharacterized protein involved in exopolysaccharide biosynthesis